MIMATFEPFIAYGMAALIIIGLVTAIVVKAIRDAGGVFGEDPGYWGPADGDS